MLTILGPATTSMCLTWLILAPEEIVPLWPIFIVLPAAIIFTIFSQKVAKKYFDHNKIFQKLRFVLQAIGGLTGPLVYFFIK